MAGLTKNTVDNLADITNLKQLILVILLVRLNLLLILIL